MQTDSEGNYLELPTIKQLVDDIDRKDKQPLFSPLQKYLMYTLLSLVVVVLGAIAMGKWLNPENKSVWRIIALSSYLLIFLTWIGFMFAMFAREIKQRRNLGPNSLAKQLDEQIPTEDRLINHLTQISTDLLSHRRDRLEMQLKILDRRVESLKQLALIGPPVLVIVGLITGAKEPARIFTAGGSITVMALTALLAAAIGLAAAIAAFSIYVQAETLQRVFYVLKIASERGFGKVGALAKNEDQ